LHRVFDTLCLRSEAGIAHLTFNNPPVNLIDMRMMRDLDAATRLIESDSEIRVLVVESAIPDYFLARIDLALLDIVKQQTERLTEPGLYQGILERFRTMPKATIGKIKGRARGAGSELALALDMRFAAESAVLGQPEIAFGFPPGGGAVTRLRRMTGRGRALEILLSGDDYSATEAATYGWVNRAIPDEQLDDFVETLARRISRYSIDAIGTLKEAFVGAEDASTVDGLLNEWFLFGRALRTPEAGRRLQRFARIEAPVENLDKDLPSVFDLLSASRPAGASEADA